MNNTFFRMLRLEKRVLSFSDKEEEDSFAEFMEYIVKKVDHKDSRAVQVSYKLYDLSRREHVSVKEIWALFEKRGK